MISADKLTEEQWLEIENILPDREKKIGKCMLNLGSLKKKYTENKVLKVFGEKFFLNEIKGKFKKRFFNEEKKMKNETSKASKAKEGKKAKGNKKGKNSIYYNHIKNKSKTDVLEKLKSLLETDQVDSLLVQKNFGFSSDILEIKIMSFFVYSSLCSNEKNEIYEVIISMGKVLENYKNFKGLLTVPDEETGQTEGEVSETLIKLSFIYLNHLKKRCEYSVKTVFHLYPNLIYQSKFHDYFQIIDIQPFPSQTEMIEIIKKSFDGKGNSNGLLLFYRTLVGSGKTSTCIALASLVISLRKEFPEKYGDLTLIFCCGVPNVRIQVGQMVFNSIDYEKDFSFAVGSSGFKQGHRVINHFSCKNAGSYQIIKKLILF